MKKINKNNDKPKILLLSDDLRMHSGIATQSKEFVMGTLHKYDWVQIGGAINHPEQGKIIDMSKAVQDEKFREEIETYDNLTVSGSNF